MSSSSIIMCPYKGESDLQPLIDLFDDCERVDKLEFSVSLDRLRLELENPSVDRDRDLALWEDTQGRLIGFAQVDILEATTDNLADGNLWFFVHPIARNGELERQIITWAEHRMQAVGRERQGQPKLFTWSHNTRLDRVATIEQHGFAESRQFWFLTQSLDRTIPAPQLPAGFTIRHVNAIEEAQAWVDLHNRCFFGSWNYHPLTVENYQLRLQNAEYIPKLDLVAIDSDGKFVAVCYCAIDAAHNIFLGRQEAWIALLFTSPDFQRRGLAKAMLFHALDRLKARKIEIAKIGVDSENAFGARQLYESIGFKHRYTNIAYVKHL